MAYLSEATHRALVGKQAPYGGSVRRSRSAASMMEGEEAGIRCTGEFVGGMRCMEVHSTPGQSVADMRVWTGEQDGALIVRDGLGRGRFAIEKKRKVYVTALMCHRRENLPGRYMYAGLSDGYLCVYDEVATEGGGADYQLICEHKKHTSSIMCMVSVRDLIVTGGRDWQIYTWRWEGTPGAGGVFRTVKQVAVHQNTVRCLAYEQGPDRLLYSGSDDCTIKCIELETGEMRVVPGGFPIEGHPNSRHGHRASVRSLVAYEQYLFSASEDGSVCVWDSQDGTFVTTLYRAATSDSLPLSLLKDPAGRRLWCGCADGVIRVFSVTEHNLVCELADQHAGSLVTSLMELSRLAATKAWYLCREQKVIRMVYSESDVSEEPLSYYTGRELAMAQEVGALRSEMIRGCRAIEEHKKLYEKVKAREERSHDEAVAYVRNAYQLLLKRKFFARLMLWQQQELQRRKRLDLAQVLASGSVGLQRAVYFKKLARYAREQADFGRKLRIGQALMTTTQNGMKVHYYRKLVRYADIEARRSHREQLSENLLRNTEHGLRTLYYSRLRRAHFWILERRKRLQMVGALRSVFSSGLLIRYYSALQIYAKFSDRRRRVRQGTRALRHIYELHLRRTYLAKCVGWLRMRSKRATVLRAVEVAGDAQAALDRRTAWRALRLHAADASERRLEEELAALDAGIAAREATLAESRAMSDEAIEAETLELNAEVAECETDIADLDVELRALGEKNRKLETEIRQAGRPVFKLDDFSDSKTPQADAARQVAWYLKGHGVNCRDDSKTINTLDDNKDKKGVTPDVLFTNGVKKLREALQDHCATNHWEHRCNAKTGVWSFPDDVVDTMPKRCFDAAHNGLKMIVIAADQTQDPRMGPPALAKLEKTTVPKQVVANQAFLMDVVVRVYTDRVKKQMLSIGRDYFEGRGQLDSVICGIRVSDVDFNGDNDAKPVRKRSMRRSSGASEAVAEDEEAGPTPRRNSKPKIARTPRDSSASAGEEGVPETPRKKKGAGAAAGMKLSTDLHITDMTQGGRADQAGLRINDVITSVGRTPVSDRKAYQAAVKRIKAGDSVTLTFKRGPRTRTAAIVLK